MARSAITLKSAATADWRPRRPLSESSGVDGIDASGNLYIADAGDNRIRFVNMTGKPYTINGIVVAAGDIVPWQARQATSRDALTRKRLRRGGLATSAT